MIGIRGTTSNRNSDSSEVPSEGSVCSSDHLDKQRKRTRKQDSQQHNPALSAWFCELFMPQAGTVPQDLNPSQMAPDAGHTCTGVCRWSRHEAGNRPILFSLGGAESPAFAGISSQSVAEVEVRKPCRSSPGLAHAGLALGLLDVAVFAELRTCEFCFSWTLTCGVGCVNALLIRPLHPTVWTAAQWTASPGFNEVM